MKNFLKSYLWLPSVIYLLVYGQSIFFDAAFPDDSYVISPFAKDFKLMLKTFYDNSRLPGVHFFPVFITQCFLVNSIFGKFAYPFGFHLYQVFAQMVVCLLLAILFYKVTGSKLISILIVTFWTAHPINLQVLTRLLCGPGIMGFAFLLLFFLCFLKVREVSSLRFKLLLTIIGNVFFLFALITTEVFFLYPLILYLIFVCIEKDNIFKDKKYLYLASPLLIYPIYLLWRFIACGGTLYETSAELTKWTELGSINDILFRAFWLAPQLIVHYLKLFFWPYSPIDTWAEWFKVGGSAWSPYSLFCQFLVLGMIFSGIFLFKKIPLFSLGLSWFFLTIAPTLQIFPLFSITGVRYLYQPSIGLFLSIFSLILFFKRFISNKLLVLVSSIIFLIFIWKIMYYLPSSKNSYLQAVYMAKEAPDFLKPLYLNAAWGQAKNTNELNELPSWISASSIDAAVNSWLEKYLNLEPNLSQKYGSIQMPYNYNLYKFLFKYLYETNKIEQLIILQDQAIKVKDDSYAWYQLADFYKYSNDWLKSWAALKKAIELNPKLYMLYSWMFIETSLKAGQFHEAEPLVKNYVNLRKNSSHSYLFAGTFYAAFGYSDKAIGYYKKGTSKNMIPSFGNNALYIAIADVFIDYKMFSKAKETLNILLSFDPDNIGAKKRLDGIQKLEKIF